MRTHGTAHATTAIGVILRGSYEVALVVGVGGKRLRLEAEGPAARV